MESDKYQEQIEKSFVYHAPRPDQVPRYEALRSTAKALAEMIHQKVPDGREKSVALTKLEEAIMWANKGIAVGEAHLG